MSVAALTVAGRPVWALALVPTHGALTIVVALTLAWFAHTQRIAWSVPLVTAVLGAVACLPLLAGAARD